MISPTKLLPLKGNTSYILKVISKKIPLPFIETNVCIINKNGEALLKRVVLTQEKDTQTFQGPDLGEIDTLFISPENDKLNLKEICLETKCDDIENRYIFKNNYYNDNPTIILHPKKINDLEVKVDMKPIYDAEYFELKESILINTAELIFVGSCIIGYVSTLEKGFAYAVGGTLGLLYIKLLENGIDAIGKPKEQILASPSLRLGSLFILAAAIITQYKEEITNDHSYLILGMIGFISHKAAIIRSYIKQK